MKTICIPALIIVLGFISCSKSGDQNPISDFQLFDSIPANLSVVNSEFDDYNSAYPPGIAGYTTELTFSSNRNSFGENYDFVTYFITIKIDKTNDKLIGIEGMPITDAGYKPNYFVNTASDEFGPFYWKSGTGTDGQVQKNAFMYSTDAGGNQDIKCLVYDDVDSVPTFIDLKGINTDYNEMYPFVDDSMLYFCSDRTENFDIYSTKIIADDIFSTGELELSPKIDRVDTWSGHFDDKCPFIEGNLMVFTSNRPGGFGGFDLWYSIRTDNGWSNPINFGPNINTGYDEYRPILLPFVSVDLMIFSSDRPGGYGGFDLYYVGVPKPD